MLDEGTKLPFCIHQMRGSVIINLTYIPISVIIVSAEYMYTGMFIIETY